MARKLVVEIIGDASSLEKAYARAGNQSKGFSSSLGHLGKIAAFTAGGAALGGLALVLKQGSQEFAESQKQAAQTAAALKSTGGVANVTAKQIDKLASSQLKLTGIDDEATKASENMLLTFTNIRNVQGKNNKIFDQTTKAVADVATRMNNGAIPSAEQLSKTSIQLGKALNDPVKGVGALRRIGVTFTDQQKKQIQTLVKSGKTIEAQKIVLKELTKEFGGSAKAAGDTLPGQLKKLQEQFKNLEGELFAKVVPALTKVIGFLNDLVAIFQGSGSASDKFKAALERMGLSAEASRRLIADLKETFNDLKAVVVTTFNIIRPVLEAFWQQIKGIVQLVSDLFHGRWGKIWGDAVTIVKNTVKLWVAILKTGISLLGGIALKIGSALATGILNGLKGLAGKIIALIVAPINAIIRAINHLPFVHINEIGVPGGGGGKTPPKNATLPGGSKTGTAGPQGPQTLSTAPGGTRGSVRGNAVAIHGPITVVANNPNELISALQRSARRQTGSRSGPYAGHTLGLT